MAQLSPILWIWLFLGMSSIISILMMKLMTFMPQVE